MNILFRADSSSKIGTGHIMRDLVLASQYRKDGNKVIFATQNLNGNINNKIRSEKYQLELLQSNNIFEIIKLVRIYSINIIVIDHYEINCQYEKKLKKETNITILALDDTYQKHHCDILLNHNISANKSRYKNIVPAHCDIRCGSKFTLLRDEFLIEKNKKDILLAMGGSDSFNMNIKILKVLKEFKNIKVSIITTTANKNIIELQKFTKNKKWIKLFVDYNKIAKLMKKSDFAIATPSVILNELYYMDTPFIAIKVAPNQDEMYQYLLKNNKNVLYSFNSNKLQKILQENFLKFNLL